MTYHKTKNASLEATEVALEIAVAVVASVAVEEASVVEEVALEETVVAMEETVVAVADSVIEGASVEEVPSEGIVEAVAALVAEVALTAMLLTRIRATLLRSKARRLPSELVN